MMHQYLSVIGELDSFEEKRIHFLDFVMCMFKVSEKQCLLLHG